MPIGYTTDKALLERIREIMEGVTRGFQAGLRDSISRSEVGRLSEPLTCALSHVAGVQSVTFGEAHISYALIVVEMDDDTAATFKLLLRNASVTIESSGLQLQHKQSA